jgi:hypothetical protein
VSCHSSWRRQTARRRRRCWVVVVSMRVAGRAHSPLRSSSSRLPSATWLRVCLVCLQSRRSLCCHSPGVARPNLRGSRRGGRVQVCALSAATVAFKEGVRRGASVVPRASCLGVLWLLWLLKGPASVVRSAGTAFVRYAVARSQSQWSGGCNGTSGRLEGLGRRQWLSRACSVCTVTAPTAGRREMLRANCDSRTWSNGRRNRQAANGASKNRATDRQQATT